MEDRLVPTGQVTGTVFLDFNANGVIDAAGSLANAGGTGSTPTAADAGVGGVVVTAYDSTNAAQGSVTTASDGSYTLALLNTGPYRLEFTNVPANLFAGPQASGGTGSGTTVQFVTDNPPATPINLSLVQPNSSSATNPNLLSNVYVLGENSAATVVNFAYNSGTANSDPTVGNYAVNTPTSVANNTQIGATWGLAFSTGNGSAYAAALTKRHTAFGTGGPGAIYTLDPTGATAPTLFVNLGATAAGANFRGALGAGYDYTTDNAAFAQVGKSGLGGLAIDDTGTFMYTVGLADRKLYRIAINADGTAGAVTSFDIPLPASVTGVGGANGAYGDLRPFAVEYHNGKVYVGAVNSAESTGLASDLMAYVFAFDPSLGAPSFVTLAGAATTTQAVFSQSLNYPRGYAHLGDFQPNHISANWNAWTDTKTTLANTAGGERYAIYPQPELTGLAFDSNGNLTLGLRDRNGDQYGNFLTTDFAGTPAPGTKGISAGDTLRATIVTPGNLGSGWTAENITAAPPTNITGATAGGQFYWQQNLPPNAVPGVDDHQALSVGGVLQLPGSTQVLVTGFDPIHISGNYDLGGIRWFDTTGGNAGGINKAYQVYNNSPTGFAKSNGIGDLIAATPLEREIGNRIWNDANGNGRQDAGEAGIQNVNVVLVSVTSGGVVTPIATATTDASGNYYFSSAAGSSTNVAKYGLTALRGLPPTGGSFQVRVATADAALAGLTLSPFQSGVANGQTDSDGVLIGSSYAVQSVGTQRLGTAQHTNDIGFRTAPTGQISGFVYEDNNNSNSLNGGDTPLAGVTVVLTGAISAGTFTPLTTTTDGTGFYSFSGLVSGTYTVTEIQPAGYLNRGEQSPTGATPQDGTHINTLTLANGGNLPNNNFGEVRPVQLSGVVYHDINNDGTLNGGDATLNGVTVVLTGVDDLGATITPITSVTASGGAYAFTNLRPGTYSVSETQPSGYVTRTNNPGTAFAPGTGTAGTVSGDVIQTVVLNSNANSPDNNFGEILAANGQLSGFVYEDNDRGSTRNAGDANIAGVTVVLTGTLTAGGTITPRTTTTDGTGFYQFASLQPGSYTVTESQPVGYLDWNDQIGTTNGTVGNDVLSAIPVDNGANSNSQSNNFGEVRAVQLSGFVYHDIDASNTFNGGDAALAGVTVVLTGVNDLGATITPQTTTTDGTGAYSFTNLRPGDYTVSETQPANYTTQTNNPGTAFAPGTGTAGTVVGDAIQTIRLNSNANSPNNNFGEVLTANAQLSGFVYEDANPTNSFNGGDVPLSGVTVVLTGTLSTGGTATPLTTTTDGTGFYSFASLLPGTYTVTEIQPVGYLNRGEQSPTGATPQDGTHINTIPLASGANAPNNNFGEVRPVQLSGFVYEDVNTSNVRDGADAAIAGVTVVLTGVNDLGATITPVTSITDGTGAYAFTNLRPGTYSVSETQPANFTSQTNNPGTSFAPGTGTAGTVSGDVIQTVVLNSNANSPNNNFGEVRTANGQLSGFVYEDNDRSSTRNGGDANIAGVTVVLTGTPTLGGTILPRTTTTDGTGFYQFTGLIPGNYTVTESQPVGYLDWNDQIGTTNGTVGNDVLSAIPVDNGANSNSQSNNFGEVRAVQLSGFVYHDIDASNTFNGGDAALAGVTVVLTGVNDLGATITPQTTTTDGTGAYSFTNLRPGDYTVSETQPANYTTQTNNPGTAFAPGTGTAGTVVGDAIQTIRLNSNANSPNNNFGEVLTANAQLSGFVYIDSNNDGVLQGGEFLIAGTTVVLTGTRSVGGTVTPRTTTTDGTGFYSFTGLVPGTYSVQEIQPTNPINLLTGKNTAGNTTNGTNGTAGAVGDDNIRSVVLNSLGNSPNNNFGELVGAQIFGYTYEDVNDNGVFNTGTDTPLVGTTVVLTGTDDLGGVTRTSVTNGTGLYAFTGLRPGTYTVSETQPAGYVNRTNTAGATANGTTGTVAGDTIQTIGVNSGGSSPDNNFGEVRLVQLSGFVYHDINDDGTFNAGDAALAGVTVVLTGVDDLGATVTPRTTTTTGTGAYGFTALRPGTYTVSETQPVNYTTRTNNPGTAFAPGTGTAGTVNGDRIQTVVLRSNANNPNNNFGEILAANAQLSGVVYEDNDNSNSATAGDAALAGVPVVLTGTTTVGRTVTPRTTTTDSNGRYTFAALQPGTYTVTETQPNGYANRGEQSPTGTTPQDGTHINAIPLASQQSAPNNNFGEVRLAQLSGVVYHDVNNDGVANSGDAAIPGTTVVLTGTTDLGATVTPRTTTTDSNGRYAFTALRPGTYTVSETQPAGFLNRTNNPGTVTNGTPGTVNGDRIQTVVLRSGANSPLNNFGEVRPGTLSGVVYEDNDNSNSATASDAALAGVTVVLVGTPNQGGAAVTRTTTTDSNGRYSFTNLLPGNYTVTQTQPAGYLNRGEQAGSTGGIVVGNGTVLAYVPVNQGASVNNNFGEIRPAQLSGVVYQDINNDGVANAGDAAIAGVTVTLTGTNDLGQAVSAAATTDSNGRYAFTGLRAGTYTVTETQPANFTSRTNNPGTVTNGTPGTVNGDRIQTVVLRSGANSPLNNFGEVLTANGQINGYVYRDPNLNGTKEGGETGLAGVTVTLLREDGVGILTPVAVAQTDGNGFYSFAGLPPGNYRVVEGQPAGFYSTKDTPGTTGGLAGGNNTIALVQLGLLQTSANNNFGEVQRTNLFGYVWVDANRNGIFDAGETPIQGSQVTVGGTAFAGSTIAQSLTAAQANGTLTSTTDATGRWEFTSLPPGTYNLQQTNTPAGFTDFASQNASGTTVQTSTATTFGGVTAQGTAQGPLNFGKVTATSPPVVSPVTPSKQNFLGSSNNNGSSSGGTALNTTPAFGVSNANTATLVAVGAGQGSAPTVRVFDYTGRTERFNFQAFDAGMTGGVRTAVADVNADGTPDIIAASGPGFEPRVRVFSGANGALLQDFLAYPQGFRGGVYVAAADVNADGKADIVTGAGEGGSPVVRVFSGANLTQLASFTAFDAALTSGVRVATGDFNGDGRQDIAASTGPGTSALVRTFSGNGFGQLSQFAPFPSGFSGGAFIAAGDTNGDGRAELVVTADQGGGPVVQVFNATTGQVQNSFDAYGGASFTGGLRIAVKDVTGDGRADIITGAGLGGASFVRIFSGATLQAVEEYYAFGAGQNTGIYLG